MADYCCKVMLGVEYKVMEKMLMSDNDDYTATTSTTHHVY
jgi:hypothetical protein